MSRTNSNIATKCESLTPISSNGCCADGRSCDEVCITIAAAADCEAAISTNSNNGFGKSFREERDDKECTSTCCLDPKQPSSLTKIELVGVYSADNGCDFDQSQPAQKTDPEGCKPSSSCFPVVESTKPGGTCCNKLPQTEQSDDFCCVRNTSNATCACKIKDVKQTQSTSCCNIDSVLKPNSIQSTSSSFEKDGCCKKITDPVAPIIAPKPTSSDKFAMKEVDTCYQSDSTQFQRAVAKYTAYLEKGICVCRNAIGNMSTCCDVEQRKRKLSSHAAIPTETSRKRSKDNHGHVVKKTCCGGKASGNTVKNECAQSEKITDKSEDQDIATLSEKGDDCCNQPSRAKLSDKPCATSQSRIGVAHLTDLEESAAREHVSFTISGMTCTGCVKKITGVLRQIDGVDNVRINFVAASGHLDLDTSQANAKQILQQLEQRTGFKCSRVASNHHTLDVIVSKVDADSLSNAMPKGLQSIERLGKAYRLTYDPLILGARELVKLSKGALAPPSNDATTMDGQRRFYTKLWLFITATVFTIPVVVLAWGNTVVNDSTKSIVSLVLATVVQFIAIPEFYIPALKTLTFSRSVEMDMLVVISITAAYGYSVIAFGIIHSGKNLEQGAFFETSTLLITLVLLGRLVSAYAKVRAVQAVSMRSLQVDTANLKDDFGQVTEVDARLLEFNDEIVVSPHSKIVSDGQITYGSSAVDESMLTGESLPVEKKVGNIVIAGTLNGSGVLHIRLTRLPGQNSITDIAKSVQDALNTKPRIQNLADVIAGWFVPAVMVIAAIVLVVWLVIALKVQNQNAGASIGLAITYSIAVLAISCPCALGLAVPLVLVIAGGICAKFGVIIKHGDATERAFKVTDVVFDKTGTLTDGNLQVDHEIFNADKVTEAEALSLTLALVKDNDHPVSRAVAKSLQARGVQSQILDTINSVPGAGIEARWQDAAVRAGNPYWLGVEDAPTVSSLMQEGSTVFCVLLNQDPIIFFSIKSNLRDDAVSVVNELARRGIICHLVSGDHHQAVASVASAVNILPNNVASRQTPTDKEVYMRNLATAGKVTLFVGDGTNDSIAIARADIGVQIGSASDVTRAVSDVVLLGSLCGLIILLDVSKQSYYRIVFNFAWSASYNFFAILLASGAFVRIRIPPSYAGLGEIVSVLPVVLAAMSLLRIKPRKL